MQGIGRRVIWWNEGRGGAQAGKISLQGYDTLQAGTAFYGLSVIWLDQRIAAAAAASRPSTSPTPKEYRGRALEGLAEALAAAAEAPPCPLGPLWLLPWLLAWPLLEWELC